MLKNSKIRERISKRSVSECLKIKTSDISKNGYITIKGAKGSNNRVVVPLESASFFIMCKRLGADPFNGLDRFFLYRLYKKKAIMFKQEGSDKSSVTHAFRHAMIKELREANVSNENIALLSGHVNKKNVNLYGND